MTHIQHSMFQIHAEKHVGLQVECPFFLKFKLKSERMKCFKIFRMTSSHDLSRYILIDRAEVMNEHVLT